MVVYKTGIRKAEITRYRGGFDEYWSTQQRWGQYKFTRRELVNRGFINAVIELPTGVGGPSGSKWSIIVFNRKGKNESIYMFDLSRKDIYRNFTREGKRLMLDEEAIEDIVGCVRERITIDGMAKCISIQEIASCDYRLSMGTYFKNTENQEEAMRQSTVIWEQREKLKNDCAIASDDLDKLITEYKEYIKNTEYGDMNDDDNDPNS